MIVIKDKKYLTIKDYALKYGVTQKTVYNRINDGKIKTKKILNTQLIEVV